MNYPMTIGDMINGVRDAVRCAAIRHGWTTDGYDTAGDPDVIAVLGTPHHTLMFRLIDDGATTYVNVYEADCDDTGILTVTAPDGRELDYDPNKTIATLFDDENPDMWVGELVERYVTR